MGRVLGLDVGTKRVGVAIGDESTKVATPLDTFERAQGRAEARLFDTVTKENIDKIIVGLPLSDDGSLNEQCLLVIRFCRRLKRRLNVSIVCVDEYLTSLESQEILGLSGRKERARREGGSVDAVSAMLILKTYLDDASSAFAVPDLPES